MPPPTEDRPLAHLSRAALAAIAGLVILASSATGIAARQGSASSPTTSYAGVAICDLKVALRGGPQVDTSVTAGIGQEVEFYGYGYEPDTDVPVRFSHSSIPSSSLTVTADAAGDFAFAIYFLPGAEGDWIINAPALPEDPGCAFSDTVRVTVQTGHPFADIGGHLFEGDIAWLYQRGITTGCAGTLFCPDAAVTREQMASFLVRALGLPDTALDFFTDDEDSIHEGDINRLAAAGITTGCGATNYCPTALVTREQMASFLVRALSLPATGLDFFTDDETSVHEGDINRLAASGITAGCTAMEYCGSLAVTRGQMAAFLQRALFG